MKGALKEEKVTHSERGGLLQNLGGLIVVGLKGFANVGSVRFLNRHELR